MESKIWLPAVAAVLAFAVTSSEALKCYECKSIGAADDECSGEMLKTLSHSPIECSQNTMRSFHRRMEMEPTLSRISNVFEVYGGNEYQQHRDLHTPMACVKMDLRVDNQKVTVRTCQTAKTAEVDPCKAMRDKIARDYRGSTSVEYCGLCETDRCNGSYSLTPTMMMAIVPLIVSILMTLGYSSA